MLTWFPTPYPDELFYSVLCRFYVSSGIKEHQSVMRQLFGRRVGINMATLYPNDAVHTVLSQLPKGVFDERDMILKHTLFPYYTRMHQPKNREALMNDLLEGKSRTPTHLWKTFPRDDYGLRHCPLCMEEDTNAFGEPYYHVEHQIPLVSVCARHKCRLKQVQVENPRLTLNKTFNPLAMMKVEYYDVDTDVPESELRVSELAREYWMLPPSISPPVGVNNLHQTLLNEGYMHIHYQTVYIDKPKLYEALCQYHGEAVVARVVGDSLTTDMVNRLRFWEQLLPDRYILLQAMLGLPTKTVFSSEPVDIPLKRKIERMAEQGGFTTQRQVAAKLKLRLYEVNTILKYYGIEPFWREMPKAKEETARHGKIVCTINEDELERIKAYSEKLGYRCVGTFALECIRYVIQLQEEVD